MNIQEMVSGCNRIGVVGTRGYNDMVHFSAWVKYYTSGLEKLCFVSGGAKSGADNLIELYATANENNMLIHYPEYGTYGKTAPLIRNQMIVDSSQMLIAFWDGISTGTAHTIKLAKEKGIRVEIVDVVINK